MKTQGLTIIISSRPHGAKQKKQTNLKTLGLLMCVFFGTIILCSVPNFTKLIRIHTEIDRKHDKDCIH